MKPLDAEGLTRDELLIRAWENALQFDMAGHQVWIRSQSGDVQRLAAKYPPNQVYELRGTGGGLVWVDGYADPREGMPALVIVRFIGRGDQAWGVPSGELKVASIGDYGPTE